MIKVQVEYKGKKEEVLLRHPTRKDRRDYLLKSKSLRVKDGEEGWEDKVIDFIRYRENLVLQLAIQAPFELSENGLDELPVVELDKLVRAIEAEVNLNAGFQAPSNGPQPTEPTTQ